MISFTLLHRMDNPPKRQVQDLKTLFLESSPHADPAPADRDFYLLIILLKDCQLCPNVGHWGCMSLLISHHY